MFFFVDTHITFGGYMRNQTSTFSPFSLLTVEVLKVANGEIVDEVDLSKLTNPEKAKIIIVTDGQASQLTPVVRILTNFNRQDGSCQMEILRSDDHDREMALQRIPRTILNLISSQGALEGRKEGKAARIHKISANGRPETELVILPNRLKVGFSMAYHEDRASITTFSVVGILLIND